MLKACFGYFALLAAVAPSHAEQAEIPVPLAVIYPGEELGSAPLEERLFNIPAQAATRYVLRREQMAGLYAKRPLFPGKPIPLSYLRPRELVSQGRAVKAVYAAYGLAISTLLIPLQAGNSGELIDTRNPETGLTVKARIMDDGTLQIEAEP